MKTFAIITSCESENDKQTTLKKVENKLKKLLTRDNECDKIFLVGDLKQILTNHVAV